MTNLTAKKCIACEGGIPPLKPAEARSLLKEVDSGWSIKGIKIIREFKFVDFKAAIEFINKVADIAEGEGHHPDIYLHGWNNVRIELYTHAINGLHENDFIVAAKIDGLKIKKDA